MKTQLQYDGRDINELILADLLKRGFVLADKEGPKLASGINPPSGPFFTVMVELNQNIPATVAVGGGNKLNPTTVKSQAGAKKGGPGRKPGPKPKTAGTGPEVVAPSVVPFPG